MRHFILSSSIARFMLLGGLLIGIFGFGRPTPGFLDHAKVLAAPVVQNPSSNAQSGCAAMEGKRLKSTNSNVANILFNIGLGRLADGAVGEISLRESKITADIYTPDVLGFSMPSARNGAELIPDDSRPSRMIGDGATYLPYKSEPLRQVRVPDTLLDIVVISKWEYELRFYRPTYIGPKRGKLYELLGEPYVVYRFRNPNPPSENRLEITTMRDGTEDKSVYFYDAELELWSLTKNGVEVARKISEINPDDPCERIETRIDAENSKAVKTVKIYKGFPWGQSIVKTIEDPDGEARTTTYTYFEDLKGPHYSFIKTTIHPDGEVERHNEQPDLTMPLPKSPNITHPPN